MEVLYLFQTVRPPQPSPGRMGWAYIHPAHTLESFLEIVQTNVLYLFQTVPLPNPPQAGWGGHTCIRLTHWSGVLLGNRSNERIVFVSDRTPPRNPAGTTGRYVVSRCLLHEKAHVTILPSPSPLGSILSGLKIIDSGMISVSWGQPGVGAYQAGYWPITSEVEGGGVGVAEIHGNIMISSPTRSYIN